MADFSSPFKSEDCQHQLFPHEQTYVVCPNCGEIIWGNIPKGASFAPLFDRQKKIKRLFNPQLETQFTGIFFLICALGYFPLDFITITLYKIGEQYGFNSFNIPGPPHKYSAFLEVVLACLILFATSLYPIKEFRKRIKERVSIDIINERSYELVASWRRWIKHFIFLFIYYGAVMYLMPKLISTFNYQGILNIVKDNDVATYIMHSYIETSLRIFTLVFIINLIYVAFCCYRQRLVLKINETDYLN